MNGLEVIYELSPENPEQQSNPPSRNCENQEVPPNKKSSSLQREGELGKFKSNMLLSFYDWPKIETSAVLTASVKNTIQSESVYST